MQRRFVAYHRHLCGTFYALDVQHPTVVDQLAVALVGLGGLLASGVLVIGYRGGEADADARLAAPAVLRRPANAGSDVLFDGAWPGHPGNRAVGDFTGQAQHLRRQGRNQHGTGWTLQCGQFHVDPEELALELNRALLQKRTHHREVLAGVERRTVVGEAESLLDARPVRRADAQQEPPTCCRCRSQGLLRQRRRVAWVGRHDADSQLDAAGLHPGQRQRGQRIEAACGDVRDPEAVEPVILGLLDAGQQPVQGHQVGNRRADKNSNSHRRSPKTVPSSNKERVSS